MAPRHQPLINHPCHSKHPLSLVSSAPYPEGIFNCDACSLSDTGFCYHCKECSFDLHIHCASLPLSLNHNSHPQHPLDLTFLIPYPTDHFSCDICKNSGSKCWLYRCSSCMFDAHLNCATGSASIQQSVSAQTPQSQPMLQHQQFSLPVHKQQKGLMLQNHDSFPRTTQAWTEPAPTGYNFEANQQPNYYANQPTFGAPAQGVQQTNQQPNYYANQPTFGTPAQGVHQTNQQPNYYANQPTFGAPDQGVQQTNQQPNYYAMNNNQPAFGAPAMGVPTGAQQTNFQNQPANNRSMGAKKSSTILRQLFLGF